MNELTIGDKVYISSKRAAEITGYAKDYIGQLCREGRVEATLVGRNWYVLETSIRAHRFGEEKKQAPAAPAPEPMATWEPPKYVAEEAPSVPTLERKSINLLAEEPKETAAPDFEESPTSVEDMQSAWREWFATRQQPQEHNVAEDDVVETLEEPAAPPYELEEEPVTLNRVEEQAPEYEAPQEAYDPVPYTREIEEEVQIHRAVEPAPPTARPSLRIVGEDRRATPQMVSAPISRGRRQKAGKGNLAIKTALVTVAIFAGIVAIIGSGTVDAYARNAGIESSFVRFFAGASVIK